MKAISDKEYEDLQEAAVPSCDGNCQDMDDCDELYWLVARGLATRAACPVEGEQSMHYWITDLGRLAMRIYEAIRILQ